MAADEDAQYTAAPGLEPGFLLVAYAPSTDRRRAVCRTVVQGLDLNVTDNPVTKLFKQAINDVIDASKTLKQRIGQSAGVVVVGRSGDLGRAQGKAFWAKLRNRACTLPSHNNTTPPTLPSSPG
jgi:hypothetical protein